MRGCRTKITGSSAAAADCIARNGTMQPVGRMQTMQCVVRYADAGTLRYTFRLDEQGKISRLDISA